MPLKINLGCGPDYRDGWVNVDLDESFNPDVVSDATAHLKTLDAESVDEIVANDLVEHLDDPFEFMRQAHRTLVPGGFLRVQVPHYKSRNSWADWGHKHTNWRPEKMRWMANPASWVPFRFILVSLRVERSWGLYAIKYQPRGLPYEYGNVIAVYAKPRV